MWIMGSNPARGMDVRPHLFCRPYPTYAASVAVFISRCVITVLVRNRMEDLAVHILTRWQPVRNKPTDPGRSTYTTSGDPLPTRTTNQPPQKSLSSRSHQQPKS
jgi:hypothetical protein